MAENKRESIEGKLKPVAWNPFEYSGGDNEVRQSESNGKPVGDISLKIDVDVSEALTGLKAVQREAKEATKALRELEAERTRKPLRLSEIPTKQLHDELSIRYGIDPLTPELLSKGAKEGGII